MNDTIDFDYFLRINSFLYRTGRVIKKKELYRLRKEYNNWLEGSLKFLELESFPQPQPFTVNIDDVPTTGIPGPVGRAFFSDFII